MKYIRTKDEIKGVPDYYAKKLIETPTLKVADTIEELCDEFVIKVNDNGYCLCPYEKALSLIEEAQQRNAIIYGAIWTDKGLIYVAKMNNNGELELL